MVFLFAQAGVSHGDFAEHIIKAPRFGVQFLENELLLLAKLENFFGKTITRLCRQNFADKTILARIIAQDMINTREPSKF